MSTRHLFGSIPMVLVLAAGAAAGNTALAFTAAEPVTESTLGEHLRAYLRLDLQPGETPPEAVTIASEEMYTKMGLAAPEFGATQFQFSLRQRSALSWDIVIETDYGMREPIMPLVLQIKQGRTTLYREIELMIDPPGMPAQKGAAAATEAQAPAAVAEVQPTVVAATTESAPRPAAAHSHRHHHARTVAATPDSADVGIAPTSLVPRQPASAPVSRFRLDADFASLHSGADTGANTASASAAPAEAAAKPAALASPAPPPAPPVSVAPALAQAAPQPVDTNKSLMMRILSAIMLAVAGVLIWRTRRNAPPQLPVDEAGPAVEPPAEELAAAPVPSWAGSGRVTPIESAYAIRGATPPTQRAVGE